MMEMWDCTGLKSADTHKLPAYKDVFNRIRDSFGYKDAFVLDPFARRCPWGSMRNDINVKFLEEGFTTHSEDALDFLLRFKFETCDIILLDPPFSDRQSKETYDSGNLYADPSYMSRLQKAASNNLKTGGYIIKLGYNSNPPSSNMVLHELHICNMGNSQNDIIISVWMKTQMSLNDYFSQEFLTENHGNASGEE